MRILVVYYVKLAHNLHVNLCFFTTSSLKSTRMHKIRGGVNYTSKQLTPLIYRFTRYKYVYSSSLRTEINFRDELSNLKTENLQDKSCDLKKKVFEWDGLEPHEPLNTLNVLQSVFKSNVFFLLLFLFSIHIF